MPTLPSLRFFHLWRHECQSRLSADNVQDDVHTLIQTIVSNLENVDQALLVDALRALHTRLHQNKTYCNRLMKLGAVGLVIHSMALKKGSADVHAQCCALLAELADENEDCQREIVDREGVQAVMDALKQCGAVLELQVLGFTVLSRLTLVDAGREEMCTSGTLDLLADVLKEPLLRDEVLVERVIAVAGRVVYESCENREKLGQLGIIELITGYMEEFEHSASVLAEAGLALRNLAFKCAANHDRMNEANSTDYMFKALERHAQDDVVVNQMLAAVANMVATDSVTKKKVLVKRAYVELLFKTLQRYARQTGICRKIGAILIHLCAYDPFGDHASVDMVASSCVHEHVQAASAIVESISNAVEENDMTLFVKMMKLTEQLCTSDPFRKEICEAGVLDVLLLCMGGKWVTDEQMYALLECVACCLSGMDSNKIKFRQLKGSAVVLQVMAEREENSMICEKCIKLLDISIGGQNVHTKDLVQGNHKLIIAVMDAMTRFRPCNRIQEYGLATLVKIACESEDDSVFMVKKGFRTHVEATISGHLGKSAVESLGNQLLSLLQDKSNARVGRDHTIGSSGTSVARRMSRSRNVGDRARARSRSRRSKSPKRGDKDFEAGRRAVLAAKAAEMVQGDGQTRHTYPGAIMSSGIGLTAGRKQERAARTKMSLETIQE